jgi:hypothetical protein
MDYLKGDPTYNMVLNRLISYTDINCSFPHSETGNKILDPLPVKELEVGITIESFLEVFLAGVSLKHPSCFSITFGLPFGTYSKEKGIHF